MKKYRAGIVGYGNVGKGAEAALLHADDMELFGVFSRRAKDGMSTLTGAPVYPYDDAAKYTDEIDVMILCGGSAGDLLNQGPHFASMFTCVDSFDTHARIPEYFTAMDARAKDAGKVSVISVGWDPGLFSLIRVLGVSCLPKGADNTFWGKGVSQGHSEAIRRIEGVQDAIQYTVPVESTVDAVRNAEQTQFATRQKHTRECFVVAKPDADQEKIRETIVSMPNYFSDYDTTVHFISQEDLDKNHGTMPHGGFVFRTGQTGQELDSSHVMEFSLNLESNPEFTASVMVACARAACRLYDQGQTGARTIFDIPVGMLVDMTPETLRKDLL